MLFDIIFVITVIYRKINCYSVIRILNQKYGLYTAINLTKVTPFYFTEMVKKRGSQLSDYDPAIIYDSDGGVYPVDIMALAVLLNSD